MLAGENPESGRAIRDERNRTRDSAKAGKFHRESIHRAQDGSSHISHRQKTQGHFQNNLLSKHSEVTTATELICSSSSKLSMCKGVPDDERAVRDCDLTGALADTPGRSAPRNTALLCSSRPPSEHQGTRKASLNKKKSNMYLSYSENKQYHLSHMKN